MGHEILKDFSSQKGPELPGQMDAGGWNISHPVCSSSAVVWVS